MEEIHFKLYKRYQKEEKILDPFKNSTTALLKKIKDNRGACQKKKKKIKIIPRG